MITLSQFGFASREAAVVFLRALAEGVRRAKAAPRPHAHSPALVAVLHRHEWTADGCTRGDSAPWLERVEIGGVS